MEPHQIRKRYLPGIFGRSLSVAPTKPNDVNEVQQPADSRKPGSRPSLSRSERSTPHIEYAVVAATRNALSLTSPAHSASLPSTDRNILPTNERTVAALTGANAIVSILEDLIQVVDLPPVMVIKGTLTVVRFILTSVLDSLKNDNDFVELAVRCGHVWLAMYRGSSGMSEDILNSSLGRGMTELEQTLHQIKSAVVLRIKEPPNRLKGVSTASFEKDQIKGWNRDLELAIERFQIELTVTTAVNVHKLAANATGSSKLDDGAPEAQSLPPCPKILHGRSEVVDEVVSAITNTDCTQTALFGAGGIGKTSIAIAALHHEAVKLKFGERRHFIPCDELGDDVSIDSLLELIAKYVGLKLRGVNRQGLLLDFLSNLPILLALDNAETVLDQLQSYDVIQTFITALASTENVSLITTSRSTALPVEVPWNRIDVQVLSPDAARDMLMSFHGVEDCDELSELLEHLGCHPLSIKLIAQVGAQGRLSAPKLLDRWMKYRTKLLHLRGGGRLSSLHVSLDVSLNSPSLLHPPVARDVLRILAFLPQGVDELNCQRLFPSIEEIDLIMDSLSQLSLVEKRHNRITLLPPIRAYIQECIPITQELINDVGVYYCHTLYALLCCERGDETFRIAKLFIYEEDANCETIIIDFLDHRHIYAYYTASSFFHLLDEHKRKRTKLARIIRDLHETHDPDYIDCLRVVGWLECQITNYREAETILYRAHRLSMNIASGSAELKADIALDLGNLHLLLCNYEDAEMFFLRARSFYNKSDVSNVIYCISPLASVYRLQGNLVKARSLIDDAIAGFKECNNTSGFGWSLLELGEIELSLQNLPAAKISLIQARDEAKDLGDADLGSKCDRLLASMEIDAKDYSRAQILLEGARKQSIQVNDLHDVALCDALLGLIQERLLHYETAKTLYQRARDDLTRIGSKYDAADCAIYLGGIENSLGDSEAALKWYLLAGEEFVQIEVFHRACNAADSIRSLAEETAVRGDHEAAKRAFCNAEELYSKIGDSRGVAECVKGLGLIQVAQPVT